MCARACARWGAVVLMAGFLTGASCNRGGTRTIVTGVSCLPSTNPAISSQTIDATGYGQASSGDIADHVRRAGPHDVVVVDRDGLANPALVSALGEAETPFVLMVESDSRAAVETAELFLSTPVRDVSTVAVIPGSPEAIARTHPGEVVTDAHLRQMRTARAQFESLEHATVIDAPGTRAFGDQLLERIEGGDKGSLLVYVGHNEGGMLRGPDGTEVPVERLISALADHERPGLVISCSTLSCASSLTSTGVLTTRRFEHTLVAQALRRAEDRLRAYPAPNLSDFIVEFGQAVREVEERTGRRIKLVISVVGGGGVVVGIYQFTE